VVQNSVKNVPQFEPQIKPISKHGLNMSEHKFPPVNLWFRHPAHEVDDVGILGDIQPEDELPPYKKASKAKKKNDELKFLDAIQNSNAGEPPTVKMVAEYLSTSEKEFSERTVRDWGKRYGYDFKIGEWVNNKDSEEGGP